MASNRNDRLRYRYGICLKDGCSKCQTKEVQSISAHKDFVCAECGKPLKECRPPRSWWDKHGKQTIIAGVVALGAAIGAGVWITTSPTNAPISVPLPAEPPSEPQPVTEPEQTTSPDPTPESEPAPAPKPKPASKPAPGTRYKGTLDLGYGTYSGDIVDGKPDGAGVLTYTKAQKVVSTKDVIAQPGERIDGVFANGKPDVVTLHKKDGNTVKIFR